MGHYFQGLTNRIIELSEFNLKKIKVAIPCVTASGAFQLAICKLEYMPEGLSMSKIAGWYFKPHGVSVPNRLQGDLAAYDPICSARPTVFHINAAAAATDDEWLGKISSNRLYGYIGSTMLTLMQGGWVLYGDGFYSPMPRGFDSKMLPFRIREVIEYVDSYGEDFARMHPYKRATGKVLYPTD